MSKTTKKRFITKQITTELVLPLTEEIIGRVTGSRGSYLLEVEDENNENYLVSMPVKFRNSVWVKRGSFVILMPIKEGKKVRAEITHILDKENILYIREKGSWPLKFENEAFLLTRDSKRGDSNQFDYEMCLSNESSDEDF